MRETRQRLENLKQTLESRLQQNQALALRAREALDNHTAGSRRRKWTSASLWSGAGTASAANDAAAENSARQEIRQQLKQNARKPAASASLRQQMERAAQEVEDWDGWLRHQLRAYHPGGR